ncbi:hypothetical protein FQN55_007916 [Onygenales sp. PD_40]|nr:hypothetical protein FQN55_007916 [Onygenales sp. PD_40]
MTTPSLKRVLILCHPLSLMKPARPAKLAFNSWLYYSSTAPRQGKNATELDTRWILQRARKRFLDICHWEKLDMQPEGRSKWSPDIQTSAHVATAIHDPAKFAFIHLACGPAKARNALEASIPSGQGKPQTSH